MAIRRREVCALCGRGAAEVPSLLGDALGAMGERELQARLSSIYR